MKINLHNIISVNNNVNIEKLENELNKNNISYIIVNNKDELIKNTSYPCEKEVVIYKNKIEISTKDQDLLDLIAFAKEIVYDLVFIGNHKKNKIFQFDVIQESQLSSIDLEFNDIDLYKKSHFDLNKEIYIFGDVHEDVNALKELINKINPSNTKLILCGDFIDKGFQTKEIIDYLTEIQNIYDISFVMGNHESFVYKRITGKISEIENEHDNFTSVKYLKNDIESTKKFIKIIKKSIPFAKIKDTNFNGIVTHAPCLNKYLGKLNNASQRNQRNLRFEKRGYEEMINTLSPIINEANENHPIHFFGHVAHRNEEIKVLNKYWLDTGSVYGNKLTCANIKKDGTINILNVSGNKLTNKDDLFVFPLNYKLMGSKKVKIN